MSTQCRPLAFARTALFAFAVVWLVLPGVALAAESGPSPCEQAPLLKALLAPVASLQSEVASVDAVSLESNLEGLLFAKPPRFKYCRCSCGVPCETDADCGGGVCRTGITCCAAPVTDPSPVPEVTEPAAEGISTPAAS